jgi:hypothetical protein
MSEFIDIKPGQWVLAFHQPFGPYVHSMPETLESYAFKHWMDNFDKDEIFFVLPVAKVMPNTFIAVGSQRYIREGERIPRVQVIAACRSEAKARDLRDKLFAIGVETGEAIEKEMYRRIEKFAARKRAAAERKIHRLLPHHFRSEP